MNNFGSKDVFSHLELTGNIVKARKEFGGMRRENLEKLENSKKKPENLEIHRSENSKIQKTRKS